jgi:hypothetical protein
LPERRYVSQPAEEADLVVPAKPVFLNAILARNGILQTVLT